MVLKNGTFDINESSAIVKKEVPVNKFHPIKKSQSMNFLAMKKTKEDLNSRKSTEASSYYNQTYSVNPSQQQYGPREKAVLSSMNKISLGNKLNPAFSLNFGETCDAVINLPLIKPKHRLNSLIGKTLRSKYSNSTLCQSITK